MDLPFFVNVVCVQTSAREKCRPSCWADLIPVCTELRALLVVAARLALEPAAAADRVRALGWISATLLQTVTPPGVESHVADALCSDSLSLPLTLVAVSAGTAGAGASPAAEHTG